MHFCIRDDDTSFFTLPEQLERMYGRCDHRTPISLAVIPFCRAGKSKCVPEQFRERWSVHALHDNPALVSYLRAGVASGRFEVMLHGFYHDVRNGQAEFARPECLRQRVLDGRHYLEDLLGGEVRVFVPPRNAIRATGLKAIVSAGLHLAGTAGVHGGWSLLSAKTWTLWLQLRRWRKSGGAGMPWVLDLGDHREIPGNAVTPTSSVQQNETAFRNALNIDGVFCVATHYWELDAPSQDTAAPSVGEQLQRLMAQATAAFPRVQWRSVGDTVTAPSLMI